MVLTLDFFVADEDWVLTQDLFQLHRSGLFLAARQEQVLSHSVVTCTNSFLTIFITYYRNRTGDPYGAGNLRKNYLS